MTKDQTPIDRLVQPAVETVAAREASYFTKSEVVEQLKRKKTVAALLADLRSRHGGWKIDRLVERYIDGRVGQVLQMRDENGVRIYECYAAMSRERRWQSFRAITASTLRAVMAETRTQARQLTLKGEGYELFLDELEKLGEKATVDDVYDKVIGQVKALHAKA